MLQSRAMILRPRLIGWKEPSIHSIRNLSVSKAPKADSPPSTESSPPNSSADQPKKLKIPPALLKFNKSNPDKPRPRRVVDARSFAASKPGGQPANILKGPRRVGARGGTQVRGHKPTKSKSAPREARRRLRPRDSGAGGEDQTLAAEAENAYRELAEQAKPVPTRYQPQAPSLQGLSETWPSFPTDIKATTAGVTEKLSSLSERYPNGYVAPLELGRRLFEGKFVRFTSEEEKAEALEAAKNYAQEAADKLSQGKGELVDPEAVILQALQGEGHKSLIESLVQGKYPTVETTENQSPVLGEVLRNLRNNETYQASGKRSQFLEKMESLLAVNRPVKRA
ncbi:uncharacterized protein BDV17DRAFT_282376 [Aspergillus undulatus]|uniref:uncharacterized protein n=1 Tax=Aspergillus undulatus TaxID=1810928 RepID=UPI003CCE180D